MLVQTSRFSLWVGAADIASAAVRAADTICALFVAAVAAVVANNTAFMPICGQPLLRMSQPTCLPFVSLAPASVAPLATALQPEFSSQGMGSPDIFLSLVLLDSFQGLLQGFKVNTCKHR